jgi:adenine/guanine phosphoribosyltransferase-like PRPP-binding protein
MNKDYIEEAFNNQKIVIVSNKRYCINSLTDHTPLTKSELLGQISQEMSEKVDFSKADVLIGEEDRGGYLCALMAYNTKKPFTLTKWNPTGLEGEISIGFRNAYTNGKLFLNGVKDFDGKKAIIVEDIIDTGGTVIAMIELLRNNEIEVIDVVAVAEKTDYGGVERIEKETGIKPKMLVQFSSGKERSKVTNRFK